MKNITPLRQILTEHGLTMSDVISRGIPQGTVAAHYYGAREISLRSARRYADLLGIPLADFITPASPTKPSGQENADG